MGNVSEFALEAAKAEARRLGASEGEAVRTIKIVVAYLDALLTENLPRGDAPGVEIHEGYGQYRPIEPKDKRP